MYSGHIIIQGCQLWPFEGNKYLHLHTFHHLNFVWTHGCNECHSPSFIHSASLRSRRFFTNKNHRERKLPLLLMLSHPSLVWGSRAHYREGWKLGSPCKNDGWQGKSVSRDWRWMVTEVFIFRMEVGVRPGWAPQGTRCTRAVVWAFSFVLNPRHLAKRPALLMLPMCKECRVVAGIPALLLRVLHSSMTFHYFCLGSLSNCWILAQWVNLVFQSLEWCKISVFICCASSFHTLLCFVCLNILCFCTRVSNRDL